MGRSGISIAAIVGAVVLTGCFSVEVAKTSALGPEIDSHVLVMNYGWNLFGCIPLVCGNDNSESWCPFTFFKNEVRQELAYAKVVEIAKRENCEIGELSVYNDNEVLFDIPVFEYAYAPIPFVLQYSEVNYSATMVRKVTE